MKAKWLRRGLGAITAFGLVTGSLAASATPVVYTISGLGLDGGYICTTNLGCLSGSPTSFTYAPPAAPPNAFDAASGTITLDTTAETIAISFSVASATFLDTTTPVNGIDEVEFTSVSYTGTLNYTNFGGVFAVDAAQTVSVSGSYTQLFASSTVVGSTGFTKSANVSSGQCMLVGAALNCGFDIGPGSTFTLGIGTVPVTRRVLHVFNVVAVPEPGTAILMALGVAGIGVRRRTR